MSLRVLEDGPYDNTERSLSKYKSQSCNWSNVYTAYRTKSYYWKYTEGVNTPDFHKRIKAGELLPYTYFLQYEIEGTNKLSRDTFRGDCEKYIWQPDHVIRLDKVPWLVQRSELDDLANEYIGQARDLTQVSLSYIQSNGWDALTFLAELRSTVSLFRSVVKRVISLIRKGKVENLWLEGRYGWRTLIYDIQDINEALASLDDDFKRFKRHTTKVLDKTTSSVHGWSPMEGTMNATITDSISISYRGSVAADIRPPKVAFNPIVTAWELVTYSFVIDWIFTVGHSLQAISGLITADRVVAAGGVRIIITRDTVAQCSFEDGWNGTFSGDALSIGTVEMRQPTAVPILPFYNLNLNWLKVADILALLIQAIRGRRK